MWASSAAFPSTHVRELVCLVGSVATGTLTLCATLAPDEENFKDIIDDDI